ncbi:MAG: hypothetical protein AAGG01_24115, partial [Planctomycetota bacterium]
MKLLAPLFPFLAGLVPQGAAQVTMTDLGSPGGRFARALFVSEDGARILGEIGPAFQEAAVVWSTEGEWVELDLLGGERAGPLGLSRDGSTAFGWITGAGFPLRRVVWDLQSGQTYHYNSEAQTHSVLSGDGSTLLGTRSVGGVYSIPFRWTRSGGYEALDGFTDLAVEFYAGSDAGDVFVGVAQTSSSSRRAIRWTSSGGFERLTGALMTVDGIAQQVSRDGAVIAGIFDQGTAWRPFLWTAAGGTQQLSGLPPGSVFNVLLSGDGSTLIANVGGNLHRWRESSSWQRIAGPGFLPVAVSDDGSVVAGSGNGPTFDSRIPLRWSESGGSELLPGFDVSGIGEPMDISGDGSVIVGVSLADTTLKRRATTWPTDGRFGTAYCSPPVVNSVGEFGELALSGSNALSHDEHCGHAWRKMG